jgi:glycosyltransferase involved in cell wall biosynthesis
MKSIHETAPLKTKKNKVKSLRISIIVPVLNEEDSILLFVKTMTNALLSLSEDFEILFVDDGSSDRTVELIEHEKARLPGQIKLLELSRNFGKEAALSAGIDHAEGDAVIPMDVDLQDPPHLILQFVEKWKAGYDVVYGERVSRCEEGWIKSKTALCFYSFFNSLSAMDMPMNVGDFRLIDRKVVEVIKRIPERNRFMKGIFAWVGFKSIGVPYDRPQRAKGNSKWNYWKLWNFALDGILSFSTLPLRIWSYLGAAFALISISYGFYIVAVTLITGKDAPGYASLMTAILFFGGVQLLSLGILGEYVGRIFLESKQRPIYALKSKRF